MKLIKFILVLTTIFLFKNTMASEQFWKDTNVQDRANFSKNPLFTEVTKYRSLQLDIDELKKFIKNSTLNTQHSTLNTQHLEQEASNLVLSLPMPEGKFVSFYLYPYTFLSEQAQAKYPGYKSWKLKSVSDDTFSGSLGLSPIGLDAFLILPSERIASVKSASLGADNYYVSY